MEPEKTEPAENAAPGELAAFEGLNPEQAADLAALAQSVADEPTAPATEAGAQIEPIPEAAPGQVAEIAGLLFAVGSIVGMKLKSVGAVFEKSRCDEVAESVAPVFADLGWNITGGRVGLYITALLSLGMFGNDVRLAAVADLAELKKAALADA